MKSPKKVLFVANVYKHLYTFHLPYIQMLKDNGCQVDVIATKDDREVENADNCYYWDLTRSPFSFKNIKAKKQLKELIEKEQYDLIHCHTATAAAVARMAAYKARGTYGTKVLYTAHGFHFYKGSPKLFWMMYFPIEKYLSRYTDGIILINTEDHKLVSERGFRNKKTYFINGIGINSKRFAEVNIEKDMLLRLEFGYSSDQFLMIYVAEYIHRKNHKFLVDASLELAKRIDDFKFLFVGRGILEQETKDYAKEIGADKYIDFLGVRWDLDKLFPICDIGVSSSLQEGLPMAVAEEMLCSLPVIASEDRGHKDLIIPEKTGYIFKQGDIDEFVGYVVEMYNSSEKRVEMGKNALENVQKFKIEQSLQSMAEIYSEVLETPVICKN